MKQISPESSNGGEDISSDFYLAIRATEAPSPEQETQEQSRQLAIGAAIGGTCLFAVGLAYERLTAPTKRRKLLLLTT